MEVAIIAALVTALLGSIGYLIREWAVSVNRKLARHDILHEQHKERDGLNEVKLATLVAELDNLTELSKETHDDVKKILANGNRSRGTEQS